MRARVAAVGMVAVLSGCAITPAPTDEVTQTASPRREALQYFPANAPVVAIVETDPTEPNVRRLLSSGILAGLEAFTDEQKLRYSQYRGLLGNDAAVGQPAVGGPPLAVLVVTDADYLDVLVEARVEAGLAVPAGSYRGAELQQGRGFAYATRGPVLLVGATVERLTAALDTRVAAGAFDAAQMTAVLPEGAADAVARVYLDVRPFLTLLEPAWREVPLARALTTAGAVVLAGPDSLTATLVADTAATGLTNEDVPAAGTRADGQRASDGRSAAAGRGAAGARTGGAGAVSVLRSDKRPVLGVADLGAAAVAAERALRAALPVSGLRIDAIYQRLLAAGIDPTPGLLAGPAYAYSGPKGPRLVWRPADPRAVAAALKRADRRYEEPGTDIRSAGGLYAITQRGRLVARVGLVGRTLVAGRASAADLRALARSPRRSIAGGHTVLHLPAAADRLSIPLSLALAGDNQRLVLRARAAR